MFRKSVLIMLFVCLLAAFSSVASAAYPWDNQLEWATGTGNPADSNWYTPENWEPNTAPRPPTPLSRVIISPRDVFPVITGDANASMLGIQDWSWSGSNQGINLTITETGNDVNFGAVLRICADMADYPGLTGALNVYGGTVRTPNPANSTNLCGLIIGGSASGYGYGYGIVNLYGGAISVPRISLRFGEINIYGGTLECYSNGVDPNFDFYEGRPENVINLNEGMLKLNGNTTTALNTLVTNRRIVSERGVLGTPTYDGSTWTTVTAEANYLAAWNPSPLLNATNVHYKIPGNPSSTTGSITLSWSEGDYDGNVIDHKVYFGTSSAAVASANESNAEFRGTRYATSANSDGNGLTDPCDWTITGTFATNTSYYWRIDEVNVVSGETAKGQVWTFKTHTGRAYNPRPADAQVGLTHPLNLSWTAGDWAQATNGHRVFVGTDYQLVFNAQTSTAKIYRGVQTPTSYKLTDLSTNWFGPLVVGTTYYWKIVEVNGTTTWAPSLALGGVWSFTPDAFVNIDDFESYESTDDINNNWQVGYIPNGNSPPLDYACSGGGYTTSCGRLLTRDAGGKYLRFTYNNGGFAPWGSSYFSETRRLYTGGTSFTGSNMLSPTPKALRIDYRGATANSASISDRMYIVTEDIAGNVSVYPNPDVNAAQIGVWTSWYSNLNDVNASGGTDLKTVSGFSIGFGVRCIGYLDTENPPADANSNVLFDNIRLYASTCVPQYSWLTDLDEDCDVDINDMDVLSADWLAQAETRTFEISDPELVKGPVLWYKFNESGQTDTVTDYGTADGNTDTGTVVRFVAANWDTTGGRDGGGCLNLPSGGQTDNPTAAYVTVPGQVLNFMGDAEHPDGNAYGYGGGVSVSVWVNCDITSPEMLGQYNGLWGISVNRIEQVEVHCPSRITGPTSSGNFIKALAPRQNLYGVATTLSNFGMRWNHWAFIKSPTSMAVYINGEQYSRADANGEPGDPNVGAGGQLYTLPAGGTWGTTDGFVIGVRAGNAYFNWGSWVGRIDDFQLYDRALTEAEIAYLATDGTGEIFIPLVSPANFNCDGGVSTDVNQVVNFGDVAIMGQQWHLPPQLWP